MKRYSPIIKKTDSLLESFDNIFKALFDISDFDDMLSWPVRKVEDYPKINLFEDDDNIYAEVAIPGVDPNSLEVLIQDNVLKIAGEKKSVKEEKSVSNVHVYEHKSFKFSKAIQLPDNIDTENASADLKNGILLITIPKLEQTKPKKIKINT